MTKRGGFTLVELLVVISVLAIILPMAGGTVFFLLRAQSQSAEGLRDAMAITQLSHTFRSDVHAARVARTRANADGCELELDDSRTIAYRAEPNGFVSRIVRRGEVVERREQFRIGAARPKFALSETGREVGVTIAPRSRSAAAANDATTSPAGIRIAAIVGRNSKVGARASDGIPGTRRAPLKAASPPKERKSP
jgi:prepilin-type N-terminal cleavage/methylation domain-containing protein